MIHSILHIPSQTKSESLESAVDEITKLDNVNVQQNANLFCLPGTNAQVQQYQHFACFKMYFDSHSSALQRTDLGL